MHVLSCVWHPVYVGALSGLTSCLWPGAVRPDQCVCVLSRGQYLGTGSSGWGIFGSIMSCCVVWSCGAAHWDRGALCAAHHSSAQQRRLHWTRLGSTTGQTSSGYFLSVCLLLLVSVWALLSCVIVYPVFLLHSAINAISHNSQKLVYCFYLNKILMNP